MSRLKGKIDASGVDLTFLKSDVKSKKLPKFILQERRKIIKKITKYF
jgi:hypothetical protein